MIVTGKTKNLGIIGYPVEHSLSPVMQNAALQDLGLDYNYIAMSVEPEKLEQAIAGIKALGFCGINVTIPHKVNVIQYLDQVDQSARMVGAVNTIVVSEDKLIGYNTDAGGYIKSLQNEGVELQGREVVLYGAGGAARAVIWGLLEHKVKSITIGARNVVKAKDLAEIFKEYGDVKALDWDSIPFKKALRQCHLVINSTPLGMHKMIDKEPPLDWSLLQDNIVISDLIYTPAKTKFLQSAEKHGHKIINGAGMLVEQGALAFELWIGAKPSTKLMLQELENCVNP